MYQYHHHQVHLFTFCITFPTELPMIIRNSLHCFYIFVVCREDNVYYFILRKHTIGFCLVYLQHYLWFKGQKTFYTRQVVYIFWCEKNQAVSSSANYLGMIYLTEILKKFLHYKLFMRFIELSSANNLIVAYCIFFFRFSLNLY